MSVRNRIWKVLIVAKKGDRVSRVFDILLFSIIVLNVIAVILETVSSLQEAYFRFFALFNLVSVAIFTAEYLLRVWTCVEDPKYHHPILGRLRFVCSFMAIIDLLAFLPFYLPFVGVDLRSLRMLRLFRLARVLKLGRYLASLELIKRVLVQKKEELLVTLVLILFLVVISACLVYYCENPGQPDSFSSIPATMWWAVTTLSTVGYGDMYPTTALGKFFAGLIAVLGIGMFALPTGILGSGFVEEIQARKNQKESRKCPHCGKTI